MTSRCWTFRILHAALSIPLWTLMFDWCMRGLIDTNLILWNVFSRGRPKHSLHVLRIEEKQLCTVNSRHSVFGIPVPEIYLSGQFKTVYALPRRRTLLYTTWTFFLHVNPGTGDLMNEISRLPNWINRCLEAVHACREVAFFFCEGN